MSLPNPSMSFTPFDILPASDLNDIVENVEALADGSGQDDDSVEARAINFSSDSSDPEGGIWWEELGRATLGVAGDTLTLSGIPARKYLMVRFTAINSGAITTRIRFNNDGGTSYCMQYLLNNSGSNVTNNNQLGDLSTGSFSAHGVIEIVNVSSLPKFFTATSMYAASNAAVAPNYVTFNGLWANTTDQITRIDLINGGAGDFAAGTEVVVLGHN